MAPVLPDLATLRHHRTRPHVTLLTVSLGFAAAMAQLALCREILAAFAGDELTIGIALSCWLMLTAFGTWLGLGVRHHSRPLRLLAVGTMVVAVTALAEVLLVRLARDLVFFHGVAVDPIGMAGFSLLLLAPFCLGSGMLLTIGCRALWRDDDPAAIARVYTADAAGSILGALLFTFGFSRWFDHAEALAWAAIPVCLVAGWIGWQHRWRDLVIVSAAAVLALGLLGGCAHLDARSTQWLYRSEVVRRVNSPYGRLVVTRYADQLTFFENGTPTIFTANAVQTEELVHFALAQQPARSVLLIGGAVAGGAQEVLRHASVAQVTCVELDSAIIRAGRDFRPGVFDDPRIRVVEGDGRRFVQRTSEKFDAILIGLPDPATFQLNRFFTAEFYAEAKRALTPGGVLGFSCGHYENYVSPDLRQLIASARVTLGTAFAHTQVLPGTRLVFLGSDRALHRKIASALERAHVIPPLVNRHYLDTTLAPDRLADIDQALATEAPVNRDFHPVLYLIRLHQWLRQFAFPARGYAVALAAIVVIGFIRFGRVSRMVFAGGFAGAALELLILVALQTFYGSLYQQVGVVVAAFMVGLAFGAGAVIRSAAVGGIRPIVRLALAIAAIALLLASVLPRFGHVQALSGSWLGEMIIIGTTLVLATCVGAQFALAGKSSPDGSGTSAPRLFSADLVGAAVGGLAVSTFLLPAYGFAGVCAVTAALNLAAAALSWVKYQNA